MVKKKKTNKIKEEKYRSEEQQEIIRFVKILLVVSIFLVAIYFITKIFVRNEGEVSNKETSVTEINYTKMVFGTMLNKPYDEYYVVAYSSEDNKASYYGAIVENYQSEKDSLNVYFVDLDDSLNKDFISSDGKTNSKATTVSELMVDDFTLIKVKSGKIAKYIETAEDMKKEFNIK